MTKWKRSLTWSIAGVLLLGFVASGLLLMWRSQSTFVPPELPDPNGYEKLLVATDMLHPRTGFYDEMEAEELAEVVEHNRPALRLARMGLREECAVTLVWGGDRTWLDTVHSARNAKNRNLSRAFTAEALYESQQGNVDPAIQCGLDSIQSGMAVAKGGLVVDWMIGYSNVYRGMAALRTIVNSMSKSQSNELIDHFEGEPFEFEDPNSLLKRELAFFEQMHGPVEWFMIGKVAKSQQQSMRTELPSIEKRYTVYKDLLITHFALRCFKIDHGRFPEDLEELVPNYLSELPRDLYSDDPLLYRQQEGGYLLYSVGENEVDNGGVETKDGMDSDLLLTPL